MIGDDSSEVTTYENSVIRGIREQSIVGIDEARFTDIVQNQGGIDPSRIPEPGAMSHLVHFNHCNTRPMRPEFLRIAATMRDCRIAIFGPGAGVEAHDAASIIEGSTVKTYGLLPFSPTHRLRHDSAFMKAWHNDDRTRSANAFSSIRFAEIRHLPRDLFSVVTRPNALTQHIGCIREATIHEFDCGYDVCGPATYVPNTAFNALSHMSESGIYVASSADFQCLPKSTNKKVIFTRPRQGNRNYYELLAMCSKNELFSKMTEETRKYFVQNGLWSTLRHIATID